MGDKPDLLAVAYTSVATEPFDDESLSRLLESSRASNGRVGLTGMLLHREGRFIQFLEGPASAVRQLFATIAADRRHERLRVLLEDEVDERQFAEWTMGYQAVDDSAATPDGFRTSFEDLESGDDRILMVQAARDLTRWFRAGSSATA